MATLFGEIERIAADKQAIKAAIENRGVEVGDDVSLDDYAALIEQIPVGGGGDYGTITLQNGDTVKITDGLDYARLSAFATNEWVKPKPQTISGVTVNAPDIVAFEFGPDSTTALDNFLLGASNLTTITGASNLITTGANFLVNTTSLQAIDSFDNLEATGDSFMRKTRFNAPLSFPKLTTVGRAFLAETPNFNSTLSLPMAEEVEENFLCSSAAYNQPIVLPSVLHVGASFLSNNSVFNSTVDLGAHLVTIGSSFMSQCSAFDQPLELPSTLTSIGPSFMWNCWAFNHPLTVPDGVTELDGFLAYCRSFNSALTLPAQMTLVNSFLDSCVSFNQPFTVPEPLPTSNGMLSRGFMYNCQAFAQPLTIPAGWTTLQPDSFTGMDNFVGPLTWESPTVNFEGSGTVWKNSLFGVESQDVPAFTQGITVNGDGATALKEALPARLTSSPYRKWAA